MTTDIKTRIARRKKAVDECISRFKLPSNSEIDETVLAFHLFPDDPSKKLALIILAFKREATATELGKISSQPAGLVKALRNDGFIFQPAALNSETYYYRNSTGEICRKIIGYKQPSVKISSKARSLLEKSIAASVSAIEIYNKPDFKYREETFSILMTNAWELLLKAKIIADNKGLRAIQIFENGKIKINRSGNPFTIDIHKAANLLQNSQTLDARCWANVELLIEIRDNAVHFLNKGKDIGKKVLEVGTASLRNYLTAIGDWFKTDLSQFNFYLMPMSFYHQWEVESNSISSSDKQTKKLIDYLHKIETQYPPEENNPYAITLQIQTKFIRTYEPDGTVDVRFTSSETAPKFGIAEDDVYTKKYPLVYANLVTKMKERYSDFKQDKKFHDLKKELENPVVHGEKYCKIRYLNALQKRGSSQKFYSNEILRAFDKNYTKIK